MRIQNFIAQKSGSTVGNFSQRRIHKTDSRGADRLIHHKRQDVSLHNKHIIIAHPQLLGKTELSDSNTPTPPKTSRASLTTRNQWVLAAVKAPGPSTKTRTGRSRVPLQVRLPPRRIRHRCKLQTRSTKKKGIKLDPWILCHR